MTDQHEYPAVSERFVNYCRFDRRLLTVLFVLVAILSAVGTLVGDGLVADTASGPARDARLTGIVLAADVFNFVVRLVHDNVMFLVLATHTLSLKYFDLILQKTQLHLGNIAGQAHISSDCYVRPQYRRGHRLMAQAQSAVSAALLMVLLRVCQAVMLIISDQSQPVPRSESLGLLPLVIVYSLIVVYLINRVSCHFYSSGRNAFLITCFLAFSISKRRVYCEVCDMRLVKGIGGSRLVLGEVNDEQMAIFRFSLLRGLGTTR